MSFFPARWRAGAVEMFGIDLRTLALFRVALGALLAFYALNRLPDTSAFLTDWGVLPRSYLVQFDAWSRVSLYLANGEAWFAAALLLLQLVCAVALLFGYRTRLATVLLFVLFTSLINRNPMILIGGDCLLACLLFWAMFLPLGARWSMDAALSTQPPPERSLHFSAASTGLLLQVMSVYFFSAILKHGTDWWPDGTGVWYTMQLERYASPLGLALLLPFPSVMQGLTYFVWFLEALGPVLAFSPWFRRPLRFAVMACFMAMHTGFILFMEIGYFPFVSLTSLTTLLGGWFWDWRARVNEARHPNGPRIYYDRDCGFCQKTCLLFQQFLVLPRARIAPAQDSQRAGALLEANYSWVVIDDDDRAYVKWPAFVVLLKHSPVFGWLWPLLRWSFWEHIGNPVYDWVGRHRGRLGALTAGLFAAREVRFETGPRAQRGVAAFVVLVFLWNLATINVMAPGLMFLTSPVFRLLRIDQIWNMFSPYPSRLDGWAVFPGKLEDGTEVDVLRPGQPLSWERPPSLSGVHENIAWHTYRWRIRDRPMRGNLLYYGKYLCREWNWDARPGKHLLTFQMAYLEEITRPPGEPPAGIERRVVWTHDCRPQDTEREKQQRRDEKRDPMEHDRSRPV
jgi:predicted DCC family thiol-disulfide oxidoreductase YuxK